MTCPMTPGDPPYTCRGCATPLPRRRDGKPHRNRVWCSAECNDTWARNHVWQVARDAALNRDNHRCVRRDLHDDEEAVRAEMAPRADAVRAELDAIGYRDNPQRWGELADERRRLDREFRDRIGNLDLEVNHIIPRNGQGYAVGCHHHLDNLETLCRPHHVEETRRQYHGLPTWRNDPRPPDVILAARNPQIELPL